MLRLVYGELGGEIFKFENREYRDAGRLLSKARDTAVVAGTLEELVQHFNFHHRTQRQTDHGVNLASPCLKFLEIS